MTKKELAELIVSGMDEMQLYMAGPVPSRSPGFWAQFENGTNAEARAAVATYVAKNHTLSELEKWADDLTS